MRYPWRRRPDFRYTAPMTPRAALLALATLLALPAAARTGPVAPPPAQAPALPADSIVAVVNGDAITSGDVENRARLFAVSSGIPLNPDALARLRPQIVKQLIDERLRLQEMQQRKVVVPDTDVAKAIGRIEQRNNMPSGALAQTLASKGIAARTLIDELRVQLGWLEVVRQVMGNATNVSDADIAERVRQLQQERGQPEYQVGEIFIPVDDPAKAADAQRFADTVIAQLRAGAPFPVIAAQFSQSQTALEGGDLGWVHPDQLDPAVAQVAAEMPPGAVSNPIPVPGGITIVTLHAKRQAGQDISTVVNLRQTFLPFATPLNPAAPTAQQKAAVDHAQQISRSVKSCPDMEQANQAAGNPRPADPGEIQLETIASPPLKALLTSLAPGQASRPIITPEGVAVVIICSRDQKNAAEPAKEEVRAQILEQRAELASRQLMRKLRNRAVLDERV